MIMIFEYLSSIFTGNYVNCYNIRLNSLNVICKISQRSRRGCLIILGKNSHPLRNRKGHKHQPDMHIFDTKRCLERQETRQLAPICEQADFLIVSKIIFKDSTLLLCRRPAVPLPASPWKIPLSFAALNMPYTMLPYNIVKSKSTSCACRNLDMKSLK